MDRYFQNGLVSSTQRTYNSAKRWFQFGKDKHIRPLPAPERQLCWFVSALALQSLCHTTIKSYLAAIRHTHIAEGFGDPYIHIMARLEQVLKGIKTAFFDACVKATWKSHLRGCSSRDDLDPHPADPGFSCHSHVSLGLTA